MCENRSNPTDSSSDSPRTSLAVLPPVPPQSTGNISVRSDVKRRRASPCTSNTCCSQDRRLRADGHPIRAKHACPDREQSQNILHTSFVVSSQEERCRFWVGWVPVQKNGTYHGDQPPTGFSSTQHTPLGFTLFRYTWEGKGGRLKSSRSRRPKDVFFGPSTITIFDGPNDTLSRRPIASASVKISASSLWNVSRSCARRNACDKARSSSSGITNRRGVLDERMRERRPDGWISGVRSSGYVI